MVLHSHSALEATQKLSTLPIALIFQQARVHPRVPMKGIGTRISQIDGADEGGYIAATFDNVYVNGSSYDTFGPSNMIDVTKWWGTLEHVRMADNGELVSELTQRGVNGTNNMSFVNSPTILGFEADLKVVEFQNNGARPLARLYAALYNDGTGNSTPGDLTGDIAASVGISGQGHQSPGILRRDEMPRTQLQLRRRIRVSFPGVLPCNCRT